MKKCRCRVFGRVQGVWFRKFTKELADRLGVLGEVENLEDGSVEIRANVPDGSWDQFIQGIKQGPPLARVDRIEIDKIEDTFSTGFRIVG